MTPEDISSGGCPMKHTLPSGWGGERLACLSACRVRRWYRRRGFPNFVALAFGWKGSYPTAGIRFGPHRL